MGWFNEGVCRDSPTERLTWEQCSADHAWHDDEEHGQHFEVASQHTASFGMRQRLGRQRPLDYNLHTQTHTLTTHSLTPTPNHHN